MKIVMPETKQRGDSPLKLIILSFIIIFFVALFAWQIEKYLVASHDSKLQGQISRMNLLIEADSLDAFSNQKYAYLHDDQDVAKIYTDEANTLPFKPVTTLSNLFIKNRFTPTSATNDRCYLYIYFPPGEAADLFDFYKARDPGYVLAGWSEFQNAPVISASPGLSTWATENLKENDFYCEEATVANATTLNSPDLERPGFKFYFSGLNYSPVTQ